jgi:hypothetical protein
MLLGVSSLVLYLFFVCKMNKEKGKDLATDQKENTSTTPIRTIWHHRSNLEEIREWEIENSAWVESLSLE